jgi:hypothetical protein
MPCIISECPFFFNFMFIFVSIPSAVDLENINLLHRSTSSGLRE